MKSNFTLFSLVLVCLMLAGAAQAACGGGGFRPGNRDKPSPDIQSARSVSYGKNSSASQVTSSLPETPTFSSRFESVVNNLKLSGQQYTELWNVRVNFNKKLGELQQDVAKAQARLAQCTGNCDTERRQVEESQSKLSAFDAKKEFEHRLTEVLNEEQLRQYQNAK